MSKTDKIFMAMIVIALVVFVGGAIWMSNEENKERNRRMCQCFEKVDDPKWCYENIK